MSSARHAKPSSRTAAIWGGSSLSLVLLLFLSVFAAVSFARPDHSFAPPTEAKFFASASAVDDTSRITPHPILVGFQGPQSVRVKPGESLSSIAARVLGNARHWPVLWWDNQSKVPNPNNLRAGIRLHFGKWNRVRPWLSKRALSAIPKPAPTPTASGPISPTTVEATPVQSYASYSGAPGSFQACVIARESGGNPRAVNPASGAGGLYQFLLSTWDALGFGAAYPGGAQTAPVSVQNAAFAKAYAESGTSPWAPYDGC